MIIILCLVAPLAVVLAGLAGFSWSLARKVEKALPPCGQYVTIGGDRIHYLERGAGPAMVMVHGLSGQLLNFAYLSMADLARSHRVILLDRPGAGYSTRGPDSAANIFAQAATVAQFIDALKLDKPLLLGHSLGGAVALAVALNHPQSIGQLALIAPLSHIETDPPQAFRGMAIASSLVRRVIAYTLAIPMSIMKGRAILAFVFGPEAVPADYPVKGGGLLGLRPRSFYAASTDLFAIPDDLPAMVAGYPTLRMPVAVLFGQQDQVLDYRAHGVALAEKIPHAALTLVDGGHMLPVTAPAMTTEWLLALVGRTNSVPTSV